MHLLYADESGTVVDPAQQYFVLAGVSVFERQGFWIAEELDKIAARFNPLNPASVELHGSPMRSGKDEWRTFPRADREAALKDALNVVHSHPSNRVFASVIKKVVVSPDDPTDLAFEQLASRFDLYLKRQHKKGDKQRGLIIFDKSTKSTYEATIQTLATKFRTTGHSYGIIRNFAEVPLFLDSRASRLIQLADLIAFAIFRNFENGDSQYFDVIKDCFDKEGGIVHGLYKRE